MYDTQHYTPKECILIRFDPNDYAVDEIHNIFETIRSQFPDLTVVCIPINIDFEFCDKETLIKDLESAIKYVKAGSTHENLH